MSQNKISKNKLVCTVTGVVVSVAPKVFDTRVLVYGSEEALRSNYISAQARKLLCTGKTVLEIRDEFKVDSSVPVPSDIFVLKYTKWSKYRNQKLTTPVTITHINE